MKDKTIKYLIAGFLFFNIWDAGSTIFVLDNNLAVELNPFMDALYQHNSWTFRMFKVIIGAALAMLIWERRKTPGTGVAIGICFGIYLLLFLYQLATLVLLGTL